MSKAAAIYKVLSGNASEEEREQMVRWIGQSAANRKEYEDLVLLYRLSKQYRGVRRDGRYYERLGRIGRLARARLGRKARVQRIRRLIVAFVCIALAAFLGSQAVSDFRPATLQFQDQTLRQVLPVVERAYGIEVRIEDDALRSCRFTGTFHRVDQPEDIIRSISEAIRADLVSTAPGKYRLLGGGC